MKKRIGEFVLCLFLWCALPVPAIAANQINTIDIQAAIYEDGSMYVIQTWEGTFDEGTENYITMNAPDYLTINNLQVSDKNGIYETVKEWAADKSFAEKTNKCGIHYTDIGYEICFGISEYGHNRYSIEYLLDNAVGSYSDKDGVNFRFVCDKMNTTPTDVKVEIRFANGTPITDEIADIWGFGFDGIVEFADGAIFAYTESPISADNHVTVMFSLEKGIIWPSRQEQDSFETVKQTAFAGSSYGADSEVYEEVTTLEMFLGIVIGIGFPAFLVAFIIRRSKKKRQKQLDKFAEKAGYFRELPNKGNTNASYVLGKLFNVCDEGAILATGMLKLIDLGCLEPITEEAVGFMGRIKESVNLRIIGGHHSSMNEFDEYLYTVLEGAAGADGILQEKELECFADQNDKLLRTYINKCESIGKSYLNHRHCLNRWDMPSRLQYLTPDGEKELGELLGFKKYLEDFSLIAERGVVELPIWKELLSYAMLFGIADRLAEQMKELYPSIAAQVSVYNQSLSSAYFSHTLLYRNMRQAEKRRDEERREKGGGGFTSMGGGSGSIGGGSGGGSR